MPPKLREHVWRALLRVILGDVASENIQHARKILKNVILVSVSFMTLFTAYSSMANLQSSINSVDGLGIWSLATTYGALVLSCLFLPAPVIAKFTAKWTIALSMMTYTLYIVAQFYPEFFTLIPTAFILGLGAAPLWSAKCTYLTKLAHRLSEYTNIPAPQLINRFFGIFFFFFQLNGVWGNVLAATLLRQDSGVTDHTNGKVLHCGVDFCPVTNKPTANESESSNDNFAIDRTKIYVLAGVYLGLAAVSVLTVALFLDPLGKFESGQREEEQEKGGWMRLANATFHHLRTNKNQMLLVPLTLWSGMEQGFIFSEFPAGFVTCALGVAEVGNVMVAFGAANAACSVLWGQASRYLWRPLVFALGTLLNLCGFALMFAWPSDGSGGVGMLYAAVVVWAVADAIWQTQINALYGVLFANKEEAAFSNYKLWESVGFIITFVLQNNVCLVTKLWCLVALLVVGMGGYVAVEMIEWRQKPEVQREEKSQDQK